MIEGIKGESVEAWWPLVEEYLIAALKHGLGEYSITDIKSACKSKDMQLWVKVGKQAKGAFVTKIAQYPQKNILCVILLGGNEFNEWRDEADALLNAFGKENNIEIMGLEQKAKKLIYDVNLKKPLAILIGSEEKGISKE